MMADSMAISDTGNTLEGEERNLKRVKSYDPGSEGDHESDGDESQDKHHGMAGMTDVICKILEKNIPADKVVVLSKYKKAKKLKLEERKEREKRQAKAKEKHEFREKNHIIPDRSNAEKEVLLRKTATRGVVKLFNAVSKHQKELESNLKTAKTHVKQDKVVGSISKSSFLDLLKGNTVNKKAQVKARNKQNKDDAKEDDNDHSKPSWDILREDFMMKAKFKDWDKEDEDNNKMNGSDDRHSSEESLDSDSS